MSGESVFGKKEAVSQADLSKGAGQSGFGKEQVKTKSLVDGYALPKIQNDKRRAAEIEWQNRKPESIEHRGIDVKSIDGSIHNVTWRDLSQNSIIHNDGRISVRYSDISGQLVKTIYTDINLKTFKQFNSAYYSAKESYKEDYLRWFDQGAAKGWIAGYDGVGEKSPRPT